MSHLQSPPKYKQVCSFLKCQEVLSDKFPKMPAVPRTAGDLSFEYLGSDKFICCNFFATLLLALKRSKWDHHLRPWPYGLGGNTLL